MTDFYVSLILHMTWEDYRIYYNARENLTSGKTLAMKYKLEYC